MDIIFLHFINQFHYLLVLSSNEGSVEKMCKNNASFAKATHFYTGPFDSGINLVLRSV